MWKIIGGSEDGYMTLSTRGHWISDYSFGQLPRLFASEEQAKRVVADNRERWRRDGFYAKVRAATDADTRVVREARQSRYGRGLVRKKRGGYDSPREAANRGRYRKRVHPKRDVPSRYAKLHSDLSELRSLRMRGVEHIRNEIERGGHLDLRELTVAHKELQALLDQGLTRMEGSGDRRHVVGISRYLNDAARSAKSRIERLMDAE